MIFVDTNYFLRFLLKDNTFQAQKVTELFEQAAKGKKELVTSVIVFFEVYWVLSSFYETKKNEILRVLQGLLEMSFISFDQSDILQEAVEIFEHSVLDLEDAYNIAFASSQKTKEFGTFDKKLLTVWEKK